MRERELTKVLRALLAGVLELERTLDHAPRLVLLAALVVGEEGVEGVGGVGHGARG
jgi:hypothetical protein